MTLLPPSQPQFQLNYDLGWIGFLAHHTFVARGIGWFTRFWRGQDLPSISHVFVIVGDGQLIEANSDGVDLEPLSEYTQNPGCSVYLRQPRNWTPDLGRRIAAEALKYKGLPYDFDLIAADALSYSLFGHLFNHLTGDALDRVLTSLADSDGKMICDKVAAVAMQAQPELRALGTLKLPARENNPQRLFADDELFTPDVTVIRGTAAQGGLSRAAADSPIVAAVGGPPLTPVSRQTE